MDNSSGQNLKKEAEEIYSNVLYVADLPNETTNEDLQRLFQDYHFQFTSLNNYKNNTAWAQVYLENKEWATRARHELNGYILKPMSCTNITKGKPIRICKYEGKSSNKQTNIKQSLLIKNIDINMTQKEFYNIFLEYGDIVSGKIEYDENGISKGFGYIYYYTEESAEEAKKQLNGKCFFGKPLEIVNLIPGKKNKSNTITLFVLNIPNDVDKDKLTHIFEQFGPVSNISVYNKGFAYVSYNNIDSASKCLNQMKMNPISFPGLPNIVVKYASSKEERESNRNFMNNNYDRNDPVNSNLNVQFNYLYINPEIKNDLDLDREIRLFIKVVMLMDFSPKEVLVDFESMSGLVIFEKYYDYNLFFKKYQEFCLKQIAPFECLPYQMPIMNNEGMNNNFYDQQNFNNNNNMFTPGGNNNNQMPFNHMQNNFRMMNNNNNLRRNNTMPNMNNGMGMNMGMPGFNNGMGMTPNDFNNMSNSMNNMNNMNYMNNNRMMPQMNNGFYPLNNSMHRSSRFLGNNNNNYFKNNNNNNNNEQFMNKNNKFNNNNNNGNTPNNMNNNNNRKHIIQRPNVLNNNNNNQKFIFQQNYGNSYNININMHPNMLPMNPLLQKHMMALAKNNNNNNNQQFNNNNNNNRFNNNNNNMRKQLNQMNFGNQQNYMGMGGMEQNNNDYNDNNFMNNYRNDLNDRQKNDIELIDQRNLQNLNPSQLLSQFNKPPINVLDPNMLNSKEQEELINEIADSIYEIVLSKYPDYASKITGMIREKGYEKMNMLLSKREDLNEIIDKAYEMIKNNKNITQTENNSDSK